MKRTLAATTCLAIALCFQTPALAASHGPTVIKGFQQTQRNGLPAGEHKVFATYVNSGAPSVTIPSITATTIDQATVRCPKPTCTLSITSMQEVGPNSTPGTQWAIPVEVDGETVDGGPYQGPFAATQFETGYWQGNVSVTKGKHTITWQTYGEGSYELQLWANTATILIP
jgi:hypothetical protein